MDNIELFITFGGLLFGLLMIAVGVFLMLFGYILPRKDKSNSALWFGWMLAASGGWSVSTAIQTSEVLIRDLLGTVYSLSQIGAFFFVSFVPYTFLWFVLDRMGVSVLKSKWRWYFLISGGGILLLTGLPWSSLYYMTSEKLFDVNRGSTAHLLFGVLQMTPFIPAGYFLWKGIRKGGKDKRFFQVVSLSMFLTVGWAFITNLILPFIVQTNQFSWLGPYGLIIMAITITYMILRTGAFKIPPLRFRVYLLGVAVILVLYFEVFKILTGISENIPLERIVLGVLFMGIATLVGYITILAEQQKERLEEAKESLEAQSEEKSTFLQVSSHQLRTPLSAIRGYLDLIVTDDAYPKKTNDSTKKVLNDMQRDSDELAGTVQRLLEETSRKTKDSEQIAKDRV